VAIAIRPSLGWNARIMISIWGRRQEGVLQISKILWVVRKPKIH
jgi:hypothetical protein